MTEPGGEINDALAAEAPDESQMDIEDRTANAADAGAINMQKERAKRVQNRTADFWQANLATKEGRYEWWQIFLRGGLFQAPFRSSNGFPDPNATFFAAGQYAFCQGLYQQAMAADIDGVRQMLVENDGTFAALAPELKGRRSNV